MSRPLAAALIVAVAGLGLAALAPPPQAGDCGASYRVVRGDTLTRIARRCGSSVAAIARASGIRNPNLILVGQRLNIPGRYARQLQPRPSRPALSYAMVRGDTLFSLARWANVSLASLMAVNPGIDPHKIEIGDRIRLPSSARDPFAHRRRERGGPAAPAAAAPPSADPPPPAPTPDPEEREPLGM